MSTNTNNTQSTIADSIQSNIAIDTSTNSINSSINSSINTVLPLEGNRYLPSSILSGNYINTVGTNKAPMFTQEQLLYLNSVFPEATKGSAEDILYAQGARAVIKHIAIQIQRGTYA